MERLEADLMDPKPLFLFGAIVLGITAVLIFAVGIMIGWLL